MSGILLVQIGVLSAISLGVGYFLSHFGNASSDGYDERQLIERGKAAHLAMMAVVCYLLFSWAGLEIGLLEMVSAGIIAVWGMVLVMTVFNGYAIFRDAYLRPDQKAGPEILSAFVFSLIWLEMARGFDGELDWLQLALGVNYLLDALMLLIRTLYLKLKERRESNG